MAVWPKWWRLTLFPSLWGQLQHIFILRKETLMLFIGKSDAVQRVYNAFGNVVIDNAATLFSIGF